VRSAIDIRPAVVAELGELGELAARAGSPDAAEGQLDVVLATGRLLVATASGVPVGVAGSLPIGDATFVSDLFVEPDRQGEGIGGLLLGALLIGGGAFVTFSSRHPAAARLYARHGMDARGEVSYLSRDGQTRYVVDGSPLGRHLLDAAWSVVDSDIVMATPDWQWPTGLDEVSPGRFWPNAPDTSPSE